MFAELKTYGESRTLKEPVLFVNVGERKRYPNAWVTRENAADSLVCDCSKLLLFVYTVEFYLQLPLKNV